MHLLSYWDDWCPFWTGGLWLLLPLMILFCVIGMFLCGRICRGGAFTFWGGGRQSGGGESPLDIAKRRYAQEEITKEQYEEIKRTLG